MIKIPTIRGASVRAIRQKTIVISNQGSKDPEFISETDNAVASVAIINYAFVPLLDESGSVVAILQLINKNGDITDMDRVYCYKEKFDS